MSTRRPPVLPAWLLRTFGCGAGLDALLGDLSEEYRGGRSAAWFWMQALIAIPISFATEVRSHPWLTLRAVFLGVAVFTLLMLSILGLRPYVYAAVDVYAPNHQTLVSVYRIVDGERVPAGGPVYVAVGYLWSQLALLAVAGLFTGWCLSRFHRAHRAAAVVSVVTVLIVMVERGLVPLSGGVVILEEWRILPSLRWLLIAAPTAGILIGGLVKGHRPIRAVPASGGRP